MSLRLYFTPFTRATRVRFLLEELGVPYELETIDMKAGAHKSDAYLAVHPLGVVPALDDDGTIIVESAAIILHLADKFPTPSFEGGLAPKPGTKERAVYFQWITFAMTTLEPRVVACIDAKKEGSTVSDDERAKLTKKLDDALSFIDARLVGEFAVGHAFSAADVVLGSVLIWANSQKLLDDHPLAQRYADGIKARPAFKTSLR